MKPGVLKAIIYHKRHSPIEYDFLHKAVYFVIDLNKKMDTKIFSINRFNIFSIRWKDYGFKLFDDPNDYIKSVLKNFDLEKNKPSKIFLITMPKVFGYGFNPVSFWICINRKGRPYIILAEVNNTFKERHGYLCFQKNLGSINDLQKIKRNKVFHVSPFCNVLGEYIFRFDIKSDNIKIHIDYYKDNKKLITTSIKGMIESISDLKLLKNLIISPFMMVKVMFLIHYHAFRLWMKGVLYIKKPKKSKPDIT